MASNTTLRPQRSFRLRDRAFLRLKRESRNLSQAELATFIGVSRSAVARWETGTNAGVLPEHAELIAIVLDEPFQALFLVTENRRGRHLQNRRAARSADAPADDS